MNKHTSTYGLAPSVSHCLLVKAYIAYVINHKSLLAIRQVFMVCGHWIMKDHEWKHSMISR